MKAGIRLGSLGTGSLKKDLQRVLAIGVYGVQLRAADTEIDPRAMSRSGREELADYIESLGFEVPALAGELGGFAEPASVDERVARTRAMLDLCIDLRAPLLTVDAGAVGEPRSRSYDAIMDAIRDLAGYALERDRRLTLTTGTEGIEQLAAFAAHAKSEGLRINYAPADLCRRGLDPVAGLKSAGRWIAHVQACDALSGTALSPGDECPLTKGGARFDEALAALRELGYDGHLSVGWTRDEDLAANAVGAVTWLKRQDGVDP